MKRTSFKRRRALKVVPTVEELSSAAVLGGGSDVLD